MPIMNSILRSRLPLKTFQPSSLSICRQRPCFVQTWRLYSHGSYGGESEERSEGQSAQATRDIEHPGPPPPNVKQDSSTSSSPSSSGSSALSSSGPYSPNPSDEETRRANDGAEVSPSITKRPSNNARPTLNDGRQSPNIDAQGNTRSDVPEDVKRHNAEMENRHDRAYNQLGDEGTVQKGFWKIPK